ncbi:hypothetical protein [Nonomuraea sp. NPDC049400]|uniref:hypothetical protein n=1 Tax=Nonomuraea sp. NPDC049400 TaxID=3364352 RepID=UPI0037AFCF61
MLLVGNAHRADVWTLQDRSRPTHTAMLDVPLTDMYAMALTPTGTAALLAGPGGSGILWDLTDPSRPAQLAALKGYTQEVESVALSADGRIALMGSPDRGVSLWDLGDLAEIVADPARAACRGATNAEISKKEWDRYTGGADWSDYGGGNADGLAVCFIQPHSR